MSKCKKEPISSSRLTTWQPREAISKQWRRDEYVVDLSDGRKRPLPAINKRSEQSLGPMIASSARAPSWWAVIFQSDHRSSPLSMTFVNCHSHFRRFPILSRIAVDTTVVSGPYMRIEAIDVIRVLYLLTAVDLVTKASVAPTTTFLPTLAPSLVDTLLISIPTISDLMEILHKGML